MALIEGYHGTNSDWVQSIVENGFKDSVGDEHWLGDGTYFFVNGITGADPKNAAVKWAIAEAFDKRLKRNVYDRIAVLKCMIKIEDDKLLDLTTLDGMMIFNKLRNQFMKKIAESDYIPRSSIDFKDGHIINLARNAIKLPLEGVKGDFYIKFKIERMKKISFRIPNCTILAVLDVNSKILRDSLTCVVNKQMDQNEY